MARADPRSGGLGRVTSSLGRVKGGALRARVNWLSSYPSGV